MAGLLSTYYRDARGTGKVGDKGTGEKGLAACDCDQAARPTVALVKGPGGEGHVCAATQGSRGAPHLVRLLSSPGPALGVGGKGEDGGSGGQAGTQVREGTVAVDTNNSASYSRDARHDRL